MWQGSVDRRESSCHGTHYVFVDVLNIVSCFAVVCLHTSLGVFMFHLLLVNLTLGGPFERILTFGQYHPFIKAIAVYLLTGIAVYVGKWCISKVKRALLSK